MKLTNPLVFVAGASSHTQLPRKNNNSMNFVTRNDALGYVAMKPIVTILSAFGFPLGIIAVFVTRIVTCGKYPKFGEGFAGLAEIIGWCYYAGWATVVLILIIVPLLI